MGYDAVNGYSATESRTLSALIHTHTGTNPIVHSVDALHAYVDERIQRELPVPPVIVNLVFENGAGHAHIFIPKHSKKLHLPTS